MRTHISVKTVYMLAMRTPVCIIDLCFTGNATGFKVYVGKNTDLSEDSLCADDPGISTGNTVEIFCRKKMEAAYLTILVPGEYKRLAICEIFVNGGKSTFCFTSLKLKKSTNSICTQVLTILPPRYTQWKITLKTNKYECADDRY